MELLGKVIAVSVRGYQKDGQQKRAADIVILSGSDVVKCTMFDADVAANKHVRFEQLKDKDAVFEVTPEVYRGQLQYKLGFKEPRILAAKPAVAA